MNKWIIRSLFITQLLACNGNIPTHEIDKEVTQKPKQAEENNSEAVSQIYYVDGTTSFVEIAYYPNGKIESIIEQGNKNGCGTPIGTHYFFNKQANLIKQIHHDIWILTPNEGCHTSLIQDQYIKEFHENGQLKAQKQWQSCYECEASKFGHWIAYDENGKEISKKHYPKVYEKTAIE